MEVVKEYVKHFKYSSIWMTHNYFKGHKPKQIFGIYFFDASIKHYVLKCELVSPKAMVFYL